MGNPTCKTFCFIFSPWTKVNADEGPFFVDRFRQSSLYFILLNVLKKCTNSYKVSAVRCDLARFFLAPDEFVKPNDDCLTRRQ